MSQWGDVISFVALAILIYRLTGSGLGVAGVVVAEVLPVLLVAPLAGVLVGLSTGAVFFGPAANSVLPSLVPDREVVTANSAVWTAAVVSQIVLAPLAGGLVALAGPGAAFAVNAATFVVSAAFLRGLRPPEPPREVRGRRLLADARDGVALLARDRLLRALAAGQLLAALSAGATSALLVVLAAEHLAAPPDAYGILVGAIGVGAALGPALLLRLVRDPRRPLYVFGPYALRGLVDLLLASTRSLPVAAVGLAVYGLGTSTGAVTFNSLLQTHVSPAARGRVFALMDLLWQAGRLASLGAGGLLADAVGIRAVYYLGGALLLVAAGVGIAVTRGPSRQGAAPTA